MSRRPRELKEHLVNQFKEIQEKIRAKSIARSDRGRSESVGSESNNSRYSSKIMRLWNRVKERHSNSVRSSSAGSQRQFSIKAEPMKPDL